ncbi:MAG: rRNA maturation RNase YbeY [Paracoccaceae bacterium]
MLVEIADEDARWALLNLETLAARACGAVLDHLGHAPSLFEVSLLACDDARIRTLNAEFRGKDKPTNVLSWPAWDLSADEPGQHPEAPDPGTADDPEFLGDIALAFETCMAEAKTQQKRPEDHVFHLIVHATLHLLGFDHENDMDAVLMEGIEIAILGKVGIANPYDGDGADVTALD